MKRLITLLILLAASTSCSFKDETVNSKDGISSVTKPALWITMNDLHDDAGIEIGNMFQDAYFIVITEAKSDFDGTKTTIQDYSELTRGIIKSNTQDYTESADPAIRRINGMKSIKYDINAEIDDIKITYLHVCVEGKEHFHQLIAWTQQHSLEKNRGALMKVIRSFHEKKQLKSS